MLITEDRGFGSHILRDEQYSIGVVILNGYRSTYRIEGEMIHLAGILGSLDEKLANRITIISPGRIRQRTLEQD